MKKIGIGVVVSSVLLFPTLAAACDGWAGRNVAVTFDGRTYTVTNMGRQWLQVAFTAFSTTYNLQLAPGQSDSPRTPGMFSQPMMGYQACIATPLPVASSGVSAPTSGR